MSVTQKPSDILSRFRLDGRTALVTGASMGIGAAIAAALAEAGATVELVARNADGSDKLDSVVSTICAAGGKARGSSVDVTNTEAVQQFVSGLKELDILVNNAGTNIPEPFVDVSEEHLDTVTNLNVRSNFLLSQYAVKRMVEHPDRKVRGGVIVNVTSQMGHVGSPNRTAYCMSKHAIEGLTKAMAVELAPQGIRVNSVAPTFVDTPPIRRIVDTPEKREALFSKIPMGRLAEIEDIAAAVLFLVSPAASMVTGTSLLVDGGWTAQ